METTVDKLEALVRKAESDLKFMNCKLESELTNAASKDMEKQLNPVKTMEALEETKKQYAELVKQYQELQQAQKEAYNSISEEVAHVCQALEELEQKSGIPLKSSATVFTPLPNRH